MASVETVSSHSDVSINGDIGDVEEKPVKIQGAATVETKLDDKANKPGGRKAGYAPIKAEFLVQDHKPVLNLEYVSSEVKEKIQSAKQDKSDDSKAQESGKHPASEPLEGEPPEKKTKLKGRNKKRPRGEKIEAKDRMCPAIKSNRVCQYGDKCKFQHDVKVFLDQKLPDLEGPCPIFAKFGFCEYSIACRFAKSHLTDDMQNMKDEELFEKTKSERPVNILDYDLRHKLWKRKYNFQRAAKSFKDVEKNFRGIDSSGKSEQKTSATSDETDKPVIQEVAVTDLNTQSKTQETNTPDTQLEAPGKEESGVGVEGNNEPPSISDKPSETAPEPTSVKDDLLVDLSSQRGTIRTMGQITDEEIIAPCPQEKKKIDFTDKLYLAPLTTVGNLPFRRICKGYGADVTCGEMALASELLKGKLSEFSLIRRHPSEDIFGAQICGCYPDMMTRCAQLLTESFDLDFIDINCGCPIDMIYKQGSGSALMGKATKLEQICRSMLGVMGDTPLSVKVRTGVFDNKNVAHNLIPRLRDAGVSLVTVHGRSREQRYTKTANWDYIAQCAAAGAPMPVFGNGDILSFEDANLHKQQSGVSGLMIARGALIKPWIFTEIKEQRHWDISSGERLDMLKSFTNYGLEHWGSDNQGVENTRRFLLEWLSFLHRYIPVGVLEVLPQKINERPPYYVGRNDLETLMASTNCADWIKITEMLLGPVPDSFKFLPKHKANAYQ